MASSLKVNRVVPSTGTNIGLGTANGQIRLASTSKLTFDGDTDTYIHHPSANQLAITKGGASFPIIRFGSGGAGGTVTIGNTTSNLVTNGEILSVRGYSSFKSVNKSYAAIYTHNEGNTSGTFNAHILFNAGGANRGGFGYMPNTGELTLNHQYDVTVRTGSGTLDGTERLRIGSDGFIGIGTNGYGNIDPAFPLEIGRYVPTTAITDHNSLKAASQLCLHSSNNVNNSRSALMFSGALHPTDGCSAGIVANHENVAENDETTSLSFYTSDTEMLLETFKLHSTSQYARIADIKGLPAHLRLYSIRATSDWDSGDPIGKLDYYVGDDTTNNLPYTAGFIHCLNEVDNSDEPSGALVFGTSTANLSGGAVEKFRITSAGKVGINDNDPSYILNVIGDNAASNGTGMLKGIIGVQNDTTAYGSSPTAGISFQTKYRTGPDVPLDVASIWGGKENTSNGDKDGYLGFATREEGGTGTQERMRIKSNGTVVVKCDSNSSGLELNIGSNAGSLVFDRNGWIASFIRASDGGSNVAGGSGGGSKLSLSKNEIYMYTFPYTSNIGDAPSYSQRFRIDTSGNFHGSSSNNISDQRLKKDIATITNPLTKIKGLTGRTFKWKEDSTKFDDKTKYGFIAQEVETTIPELVDTEHGIIFFDKDDKVIYDEDAAVSRSKAVSETGVIPIAVEALKELIAKVETLETKVAALESS